MLSPRDLLKEIVEPVLAGMEADSVPARKLLLGTALAESGLRHLRQLAGGPALGLWQMEPATHDDIWRNFLHHRDRLEQKLAHLCDISHIGPGQPVAEKMMWNLRYACAMARIHYLRVPGAIPEDVAGQAAYWKRHYNTPAGKGSVEHYLDAWERAE